MSAAARFMRDRVRPRSSRGGDHLGFDTIARVQETAIAPQQLAEELLAVVGYVMKSGQADALRAAAGLDLSLSQLRALHVLEAAEREPALHELAAAVGLSVATCGRAVDGLVRDGLVTRREDADDRRVKRLAASERGREVVLRMIAARREAVGRIADTLDDGQRAALSAALAPVLARPDVQSIAKGVCR
jgi:DNA-binding MarR family transcriptional regulator